MKSLGYRKLTKGFDAECVLTREISSLVGDKWSVLVTVLLGDETKRFSDLKREIVGISPRMWTLTLRGLEQDGLVKRTVFPTVPRASSTGSRPSGVPAPEASRRHSAGARRLRAKAENGATGAWRSAEK